MNFLRDFGLPELLIILVIIIIVFGPGRIGKVAGELGKGIRSFRDNLSSRQGDKKDAQDDEDKPEPPTTEPK